MGRGDAHSGLAARAVATTRAARAPGSREVSFEPWVGGIIAAVTRTAPPTPILPPLPVTAHERFLLAWHPEEGAFWLVTDAHGVYRVSQAGAAVEIADADAVGERTELHETLHFDPARRAMVHVSRPDTDGPLQVAVWKGKAFAAIKTKGGPTAGEHDGVVFDARRGVLVHLAMPAEEGGALLVRELDVEGTWRAPRIASPPGVTHRGVIAGWDAAFARVVFVDRASLATYAWDGASCRALGKFPEVIQGWPWTSFQAPGTGNLTLLLLSGRGGDMQHRSSDLWELQGEAWHRRDAGTLEVFGGAASNGTADGAMVSGPWFGAGTLQRSFARYDGRSLLPAGLAQIELEGGSTAGPPRFWGRRAIQLDSPDRALERRYAARVVHELREGRLVTLSASPEGTDAISSHGAEALVLTAEGEAFALGAQGWTRRAEGHPAWGLRRGVNVGRDGRGRVFALSGTNAFTGKLVASGFILDGEACQPLPGKDLPLLSEARIVADEAADRWIVFDGRDAKGKHNAKVYELAAGKWSAHPSTLRATVISPTVTGWDAATQRVFLVVTLLDENYASTTKLFTYAGKGKWEDHGEIAQLGGAAYAYDAERRVAVAVSVDGVEARLQELDVGKALDAIRGTVPAKAAATGPDAAKPIATQPDAAEPDAAEPNAPEPRLRKKPAKKATAHVMRFGSRGEDQLGGLPRGVGRDRWPACKSCGVPMQHVITLHAEAGRLKLTKHAALSVFACNTRAACATWDPDAGCNAVLLTTTEQLAQRALAKPPVGARGEVASPIVDRQKIAYDVQTEDDPASDVGEIPEAVSKVGGFPVWVQSEAVPACRRCKKPMRFVAQLLEETGQLNFGGGDGYVFCCQAEHHASFLWQQ